MIVPLLMCRSIVHEFKVYDKRGRLVRHGSFCSRSFTRNFVALQRLLLFDVNVAMWDRTNAKYTISREYIDDVDVAADEGNYYYGIILGTNNTQPAADDYWVKAVIAHSDTGLYYYAMSVSAELKGEGDVRYFTLSRTFENKGTDTITFYEVGLGAKIPTGGTYYLLARDTTSTAKGVGEDYVTIEPGYSLVWVMKPQIVV